MKYTIGDYATGGLMIGIVIGLIIDFILFRNGIIVIITMIIGWLLGLISFKTQTRKE